MINDTKGIAANPMQSMRIKKYPMQIKDTLIVDNNLEEGVLGLYEHIGGPLTMQQLLSDENNGKNATLIAQLTISVANQTGNIVIDKIFCCYGFEHLVYHMIYQVVFFARFYESTRSVRISECERENWFLNAGAGGILQDFSKTNEGYYEYRIR